ncbi:MAG: transposase, partial [Methylocella sp.]
LQRLAVDGETVAPSLPEPGMWTGMARANVLGPLRWKRAKIHRRSRRRNIGPHHEAGYTSAVVTEPESVKAVAIGRGQYTSTYVFLDNAPYHHAKLVQEWLAQPGRRIKLHFIPSYPNT